MTIIAAALLLIAIRGVPLRFEGNAFGDVSQMAIQVKFADELRIGFEDPLAVGFGNPLKIANPDLSPAFFVDVSR